MGRGDGADALVAAPRRSQQASFTLAKKEDIPQLLRVKKEVIRRAYAPLFDSDQLEQWIERQATEKFFDYRIGRKDYYLTVAREGSEIVGFGCMRRRGQRADISNVYVLNPAKGYGTQIVDQLQQIGKGLGCQSMRASIFRNNEASIHFFEKRGLQRSGGGFREQSLEVRVDHYEGKIA